MEVNDRSYDNYYTLIICGGLYAHTCAHILLDPIIYIVHSALQNLNHCSIIMANEYIYRQN